MGTRVSKWGPMWEQCILEIVLISPSDGAWMDHPLILLINLMLLLIKLLFIHNKLLLEDSTSCTPSLSLLLRRLHMLVSILN